MDTDNLDVLFKSIYESSNTLSKFLTELDINIKNDIEELDNLKEHIEIYAFDNNIDSTEYSTEVRDKVVSIKVISAILSKILGDRFKNINDRRKLQRKNPIPNKKLINITNGIEYWLMNELHGHFTSYSRSLTELFNRKLANYRDILETLNKETYTGDFIPMSTGYNNAKKQCENLGVFLKKGTRCYICGIGCKNIYTEKWECEHILPIKDACEHFWLYKSLYLSGSFDKDAYDKLMRMEYKLAHKCCNQKKRDNSWLYFKEKEDYDRIVMAGVVKINYPGIDNVLNTLWDTPHYGYPCPIKSNIGTHYPWIDHSNKLEQWKYERKGGPEEDDNDVYKFLDDYNPEEKNIHGHYHITFRLNKLVTFIQDTMEIIGDYDIYMLFCKVKLISAIPDSWLDNILEMGFNGGASTKINDVELNNSVQHLKSRARNRKEQLKQRKTPLQNIINNTSKRVKQSDKYRKQGKNDKILDKKVQDAYNLLEFGSPSDFIHNEITQKSNITKIINDKYLNSLVHNFYDNLSCIESTSYPAIFFYNAYIETPEQTKPSPVTAFFNSVKYKETEEDLHIPNQHTEPLIPHALPPTQPQPLNQYFNYINTSSNIPPIFPLSAATPMEVMGRKITRKLRQKRQKKQKKPKKSIKTIKLKNPKNLYSYKPNKRILKKKKRQKKTKKNKKI